MFAPNFHSAMKYVGPIRKKLKRTIFNMIGPLSSPALLKNKLLGYLIKSFSKFCNALKNLDITNAWIVNSEDGLMKFHHMRLLTYVS